MEWNTRVLLHTQQPVLAEGLAAVLDRRSGFELVGSSDSLSGMAYLTGDMPDILLIDMASDVSLAELQELRLAARTTAVVLWGGAPAEEFVFQAIQLGIRGMVPSRTPIPDLLEALRAVRSGELHFPAKVMETVLTRKRVVLTARESQLVGLATQGLSNKEIAASLDLTEGTVKIYLSKLFKKLHLNDRLDLALYGLRNLFGNQIPSGERTPDCPRSLPLREHTSLHFLN